VEMFEEIFYSCRALRFLFLSSMGWGP